ncbi:MAG: hypothetical protein E6Q24_13445 [Chitinophagaceae bacterium]|nr:MAG: hypothetical protein E6Q24_13445 [Chitinophagaceae bacterium]
MITVRKFLFPLKFIALPVLFLVLISSCGQQNEGGVRIPVPKDTSGLAEINHFIPVEKINEFQKSFVAQRDSLTRLSGYYFPISETFNKQALLDLLKDSANVGIRIYYGLKTGGNRNEIRLVLVGVNSEGQDLYYEKGGQIGKVATQVPPGGGKGGVEYGQCDPPCEQ